MGLGSLISVFQPSPNVPVWYNRDKGLFSFVNTRSVVRIFEDDVVESGSSYTVRSLKTEERGPDGGR